MPTYQLQALPGEPIVIVTIFKDYSIARDMPLSDAEGRILLETLDEPVFYITDITRFTPSMDDLLLGANRGARGEDPMWHHPKIREMVFVSPSTLIHVAAKGMNTVTFGNLKVQVFRTVDEALAYCRAEIEG